MPKTTVIDLLNEYLAKGQMPPAALLQQVAESEALKAPPAALDPVQLASGAYAFGPLSELANESIGAGAGYALPKLLKMAPSPQSGLAMPIGGRATSDLAGGKTAPFEGIQLPGGGKAAKGTSKLPGTFIPKGFSDTNQLELDDAIDMSVDDAQAGNNWKDLVSLLGGTAKGQIPADFLEQSKATTAPLPPQGANTAPFGGAAGLKSQPNKDLKVLMEKLANKEPVAGSMATHGSNIGAMATQPKTEPLTPFEAHENVIPPVGQFGSPWDTHILPGGAAQMGQVSGGKTEPLQGDNRTMSLEPSDIEEMVGGESPPTEALLEALKQNLNPKDTRLLPENALYHGLNVFGSTQNAKTLGGIASEGMKGGWFSEEPHKPFGPNYIATRPEDLPPLLVRDRQFNVDPEKEIFPRWKQMSTENLETAMKLRGKSPGINLVPETVKGRPAMKSLWPNIHQLVGADEGGGGHPLAKGGHVVPPEKLFLTNQSGETIGRMAPKGGKPNAISALWDKAKAFRNVLQTGTSGVNNTFNQLLGGDPEHAGATQAQKVAKLKQFLKSEPTKGDTVHEIWSKFADVVKQALMTAGEDIPK